MRDRLGTMIIIEEWHVRFVVYLLPFQRELARSCGTENQQIYRRDDGWRVMMKRAKRLVIDPEMLVRAMQDGGWRIVGCAVPDDATVIRVYTNSQTAAIELIIESMEFEPVLAGNVIPMMGSVQFERVSS